MFHSVWEHDLLKRKSKILQINSAEMQDYLVDQLEADIYFTGDAIQLNYKRH
jgi:RNA polymerase sigma-70 factor (ECF subfamily)